MSNSSHPLVLAGGYGSPYSIKMRAVLRYRQIPFRWVLRNSKWDDLPKAPVQIIPVIVFPNDDGGYGEVMVDSSPLITRLETEFSERSLVPTNPAVAFIDYLIEDYADEWVTKAMYHYRWTYAPDIEKAGQLLPLDGDLHATAEMRVKMHDYIIDRQISRRALVGSTDANLPILEDSYKRLLDLLEAHLSTNDFMVGNRPGRGDFGLFGQLSQLIDWDPTPMAIAIGRAPRAVNWVARVDDLSWWPTEGDAGWFGPDELPATTHALLAEIGRTYAPFMLANAAALQSGADEVVCQIDGAEYRQGPFKYQGKCLGWLREEYQALDEASRVVVDEWLAGTGCEALLA